MAVIRVVAALLVAWLALSLAGQNPIESTGTILDDDDAAAVIDAARRIDWEPGVPGGIPNYTTLQYTDTGAVDTVAALQAQLDACSGSEVVQLQAGTYDVTTELYIGSGCVLRGAGVGSSILNCTVVWNCVMIGDFPAAPSAINVSGSPAAGDTQITVASTTGLSVNDYVVIDQINDGVEVVNDDFDASASPCRAGSSGTRCLGQILRIDAIDGLVLTISPPIHHAFVAAQTPQVWELTNVTTGAGLEDLTVTRINDPSDWNNVSIVACSGCWVDNIESNDPAWWHVEFNRSIWSTVQHSTFDGGQGHESGRAYGVVASTFATANLIENNIMNNLRHGLLIRNGASGNVYGYNYSNTCRMGDFPESWLSADAISHGAHSTMNLYEGNSVCRIRSDNTSGSSSYNTYYRNHSRRASDFGGITQALRAVDLDIYNTNHNVVGNVLGTSGQAFDAFDPGTTRSPTTGRYVYTFGFFSDGDGTSDAYDTVRDSTHIHANYDFDSDAIAYLEGYTQTLPDSLYLAAKPSWYGDCVWPPVDPVAGTVEILPAEDRELGGDGLCTPQPLSISTMSMAGGIENQSYNQTVLATGGTEPYAFDNNGAGTTLNDSDSECAGLSIASSGAVTGTPTVVGDCSFVARVTDDVMDTDTQALTIAISASGGSEVGAGCFGTPDATTSNASSATVQAAIAAASAGDCIRISGSATWSTTVTLNKAITLDCNDGTLTRGISTNSTMLSVDVPAGLTSLTRITNCNFSTSTQGTGFDARYISVDIATNGRFRLDHNDFGDANERNVEIYHNGYFQAVVDNNTFIDNVNNEYLHNRGYGFDVTTGWSYDVTEGSEDALYVEDNDWNWNGGSPGANACMQNYYGSRTVFRYNDLDNCLVDVHGTAGHVGGRWIEIYENDWNCSANCPQMVQLRGGTGVVTDNRLHNLSGASGGRNFVMWEDDTGTYPLIYQPGRGTDQALDPIYFWDNTVINDGGGTDGFGVGVNPGCSGCIQEDRDYYVGEARAGYTPYSQYPHPLRYVEQ